MASQQVHDMTGRCCKLCKKPFTTQSMNLTISIKEGQMMIKQRVCGKCHHEFMSKGE